MGIRLSRLSGCFIISLLVMMGAQAGYAENHPFGVSASRPPTSQDAEYAPGEVLVKFKDSLSGGPNTGLLAAEPRISSLSVEAQAALEGVRGDVAKSYMDVGVHLVSVPASEPVGRVIEALYRSGAVEYAEPNYRVESSIIPDDPRFKELWGLRNTGQAVGEATGVKGADIGAPGAWDVRKYANDTVVVVIDSGVDYTHEDLKGSMWRNPREIPGNGVDDDQNGYVDDLYGIDLANDDSDPMDDNGHGTHCAGIIGAVGNNGKGVVGVSWKTRIMALKFLDSAGSGWTKDAIESINYALAVKRANNYPRMVINGSWGGGNFSQALYDAVKAAQREGVLFVAAAGNTGLDTDARPHYPSSFNLNNIISVGASDMNDQPAYFSNYGAASVDLFAPGENILSTFPGNAYSYRSGTSMAAPYVTGASALIWTQYPQRNWRGIKGMILNGSRNGRASALLDKCLTGGRLDLKTSIDPALRSSPAVFSVKPNRGQPGDTIRITGAKFGSSPGRLKMGENVFPADSIVEWTPNRIVARLPNNLAIGTGRVKVATRDGVSRGAVFQTGVFPAVAGHTIFGRAWACSAQVGNHVWIMSGGCSFGQTGIVEKYSLVSNRSVIKSNWMIPVPVTNADAAAIDEKIYVVGGMNWDTGKVYDLLQIFDTKREKWRKGAALPQPLYQPVVASYDGKLFVFGGVNVRQKVLNTTYTYDPSENRWRSRARLPVPTSYAASVHAGSGKIWIMGGFSHPYFGEEQRTVQVYDVAEDSWGKRRSMSRPRGGAAGIKDRSVYCLFGSGRGGADGELFEQSDRKWLNVVCGEEKLFTPMAAGGSLGVYTLGGYDLWGGHYSNTVWFLRVH